MLKDHQDAMGRGYWDYLNGREDAAIVIERDDGLIEVGMECHVYFADYPSWPPHQRRAMELVRGRVLDVGCGAGRHSLHLQRQGHDVVAIDESPLAIRVCRRRGVRDARVLRLTQVSAELGCFDTVLMLGNNFGIVGSPSRAKWILRRLRAIASPEALIIAECADPHATARAEHLAYHERNRRLGRLPGQARIRARYAGCVSSWMDLLLVSRDEMTAILNGTGWQVREFIDTPGSLYVAVIEPAAVY